MIFKDQQYFTGF